MISDIRSTESLNLIGYISEAVEGLLNVFVVQSLESVEEATKSINSGVSLSGDTFIDL